MNQFVSVKLQQVKPMRRARMSAVMRVINLTPSSKLLTHGQSKSNFYQNRFIIHNSLGIYCGSSKISASNLPKCFETFNVINSALKAVKLYST